jgi:hypothetical protein
MMLKVVLNLSNGLGLIGSGRLLASLIIMILTAFCSYLLGSLDQDESW